VPETQPIGAPNPGDDRLGAGKPDNPAPVIPDPQSANLVLPPPETKRWSSRRKAAVVVAIRVGAIAREEACMRYMLSNEELTGWERAFDRDGIPGLRNSHQHPYRVYRMGPFSRR
jgi:hypothetical protein